MMAPTTIYDDEARAKLDELAAWLSETNKFQKHQDNLLRCTDEDRHVKVDPLLEKLAFKKTGYGYSLWRVTGRCALEASRKDYQALFFPLSIRADSGDKLKEVRVATEILSPGTYIPFTNKLSLDGLFDFLIVYLPGNGSSAAEN